MTIKQKSKKLAVINASIYTMNKANPKAGSMLIGYDGKIENLSREKSPLIYDSNGIEVFDACGKAIIPGFVDAHIHLVDGGVFKSRLNLRNCKKPSEMRAAIKEYVSKSRQEWVIGYGFTDDMFENRKLSKALIDKIEHEKPVILIKSCGHSALVNSKAVDYINGDEIFTDDDYEKLIETDNEGRLTGVLFESAYRKVIGFIEKKHGLDYKKIITDTIRYLLSQGITTVYDNTFHKNIYEVYRNLRREDKLKLRIQSWLYGYDKDKRSEMASYTMNGDDMLNVAGAKYFLDGSITSNSAYLRSPYSDDSENKGMLLIDVDTFYERLKEDISANLQPVAHCIGDASIELYLDIIDKLCDEKEFSNKLKHIRPRIEHCTLLAPDLMQRLIHMKPVITYQQGELNDAMIGMYCRKLGKDRTAHLDEVRFMLDNDIPVAFSSDWPYINLPEPFSSLDSYRSRNDEVSLFELFNIYTQSNAYAGRMEDRIGILAKSYYADFVVLNKNPFDKESAGWKTLSDINVCNTFVNGRLVYKNEFQ